MTVKELAELVRRMRAKQSQYFRTRDRTVLAESKDLERRVDAAVADVLDPKQPDLFAGA